MRRNVSGQFIGAQMISASDGSAFTGSVTVSVTGDAGTQATGSVGSGACTHEGNGYHTYAPAQAETNYTQVAFTFTGTGAIPVTIQVFPIAYDSSGRVDVGVIGGDAQSLTDLKDFVDTGYNPSTHKVAGVVLVDTTTTNTDMRGTDSAALASNYTSTRAGYLDELAAANIPADLDAVLADTNDLQTNQGNWLTATGFATSSALSTLAGTIATLDAFLLKVRKYLMLALRKDAAIATDASTELGELNADLASGAGAFSNTTDSLEANRDNIGTAGAGLTEAGGDGDQLTAINLPNQTMDIVGNITGNLSGSVGSVTGNVGGSIGSLATQAKADVNAEADTALLDYDPPTRTEATADKNEILAQIQGFILANGTIGDTGNDTTHIHIPDFTYGDDEINNYLFVIFDNSASEYHARYIADWVNSSKLATVSTLPFTPEDSVDGYFLLPFRQDVTGGSGLDAAGVRAAIGMASANLDTQLDALPTAAEIRTEMDSNSTKLAAIVADTNELQTDWTNGGRLDLIIDAILADSNELQTNQGNWLTATGFSTHSAADVWAVATRVLTAGTNIALAKGTGVTGFNDLSAAQVNAEVDTALGDYDAPTYTEVLNMVRLIVRKDAAIGTDLSSLLTAINADLASGAGSFVNTTDALEAIRDRGDAAWATVAASAIRSALGMASANMDTQLAALPTDIENAAAVLSAANASPIDSNVKEVNDVTLTGDGSATPWGPA